MNEIEGEYYLHENGSLIYKPHGGVQRDSNFVKRVWNYEEIAPSPQHLLNFLTEAKKLGALNADIYRIANHNNLSKYIPDWENKL